MFISRCSDFLVYAYIIIRPQTVVIKKYEREREEGRKEMFYLTTIQIAREETRCRHIGYFFRLAAKVLLYASPHNRITYTMAFVKPVVEH